MGEKPFKFGSPGPNSSRGAVPGFSSRFAKIEDLGKINELGSACRFDCDLPILKLYFETSPTTFIVCEETATGKIVAYDSWNRLPNGIFMGFQIMTHPNVRGKGLTRLFKTMNTADFHFLGDQTPDSLARYPMPIFGQKIVGYYGMLRKQNYDTVTPGIRVEKLEKSHFANIFNFDFQLLGIDRSKFLRKWTLPSNSEHVVHSYVATSDEQVVGYGTIRWYEYYWQINPLYANSPAIAQSLLDALTSEVSVGEGVFLRAPAKCRMLHDFSLRNKFLFWETECRSYSDEFAYREIEKNLDWSKVYALQEFWPV